MQEESSRRKPRIPLSAEELFYLKKIKELKEIEKIQKFKLSAFYKYINSINIFLIAFLSYCLLSILMTGYWQKSEIVKVKTHHGKYNKVKSCASIIDIELTTSTSEQLIIVTNELYQEPKIGDVIYLGKDYLLNKTLRVRLIHDERDFWNKNAYPILVVILFALTIGVFIYIINKHLTINGLLTAFALFLLSSLYYVLV
jgi:hypothetical protein